MLSHLMTWLPLFRACFSLLLSLAFLSSADAAQYRFNRAADSALMLYPENQVSVAADEEGNLYLVYTDASPDRKWHIYYRTLKGGFWSIPTRISTVADILDNRSPQIFFEAESKQLYVFWVGLSSQQTARNYKLLVHRIDPTTDSVTPVAAFDYGLATFRPRIVSIPGRLIVLSEERIERTRSVFRTRVLSTASAAWDEERTLQSSATEAIHTATIAASAQAAGLFWVRTTSSGYDVMVSTLEPASAAWSAARVVFHSQVLPENPSATAFGNSFFAAWTVKGGGRNSIVMQTSSADGGRTWNSPGAVYSAAAGALTQLFPVSEQEVGMLLEVRDEQGEKLKLKYSSDGGEHWLPASEIEAYEIGPKGPGVLKSQRPSLVQGERGMLLLAWEDWLADGPVLALQRGTLAALAKAPKQVLVTAKSHPGHFPYYPQIWMVGKKAYVSYASKQRTQTAMERNVSSDLYITDLPALPVRSTRPAGTQPKPKPAAVR